MDVVVGNTIRNKLGIISMPSVGHTNHTETAEDGHHELGRSQKAYRGNSFSRHNVLTNHKGAVRVKCQEVLKKYNNIVPFPISREKVQKAGYKDPVKYLEQIAREIKECEDSDQPVAQEFLKILDETAQGGTDKL